MGKRPQQTFSQRRHADGQQEHEKMLSIAYHQGNANQNHNETSLASVRMRIIKKNTNNKRQQGCGEKGNLYTVGGNVNWYSHCGKLYGGFSNH